ncbi:MAG: hypothetical protein ACOYIF_02590 [Acetivibrionales bacterium]|jgi:hypothetical protein
MMERSKKSNMWVRVIIAVPIIIIILMITPFLIAPIINDITLNNFANQLYKYPLPENTVVISEASSIAYIRNTFKIDERFDIYG